MHTILEVVWNGAYSSKSIIGKITAWMRKGMQIYIECFLKYRCKIFHKPLEEWFSLVLKKKSRLTYARGDRWNMVEIFHQTEGKRKWCAYEIPTYSLLNGMLRKRAVKCQNLALDNMGSRVSLFSCEDPRVKVW